MRIIINWFNSGNHAQALALAAKSRNITAHIVMPNNSPIVKKNAVKGYGAIVYECEPNQQARESTCDEIIKKTGATLIHPYDNVNVISGQGTIVLELVEQLNGLDFDTILCPVGGGGLLSGVSIAAKSLNEKLRIIAAEPKGADDASRSLKSGKLLKHEKPPKTIADGLLTTLGSITWPIIQKNVERVITVR